MSGKRRLLVVGTALAIGIVLGVGTTVVLAGGPSTVVATGTGADINRVKTKAAEGFFILTDPTSSDGPVTSELPGARHRLVLAEETLVVARFQALAKCAGPTAGGECRIEIHVLDNNAGDAFVAAMEPDLDDHWEFANPNDVELGGIERSSTLPPGDYDFQVVIQAEESTDDTAFVFSDWHFTVERIV